MPAKRTAVDRYGPRAVAEAKAKIVTRPLLQEREFPFTASYTFYERASETYHLNKLLDPKVDGNLQIVHEFYANACVRPVWRFPIRGVDIDFTLDRFRQYLGLIAVDNCEYRHYLDHPDTIPEDQISQLLDGKKEVSWQSRGGEQKYLLRTRLSVEGRVWLHFGKDYFWPSSNRNRLTRDQALLIFLLINKEPVDLGYLIHTSLRDHVHDHHSALILPHLISAFCIEAGVDAHPTDVIFKPIKKFQYQSIKVRVGEQVPPPQQPSAAPTGEPSQLHPEQGEPSGGPSSSPATPTLDLIFSAIQRTEANVAQCLTYLQDHGVRLTRLEELLAAQAPNVAPAGGDDDDDADDDDDEEEAGDGNGNGTDDSDEAGDGDGDDDSDDDE